MTSHVRIVEVGPRDGLQNEPGLIPIARKVEFIDLLSQCGFSHIEAASFVSAQKVPQMADGDAVMAAITRHPYICYSALVPNLAGLNRAMRAGVNEVAVFASASETFSQRNIDCSIDESIERFRPVIEAARDNAIAVRGYISCVIACPYGGDISPDIVATLASTLLELGCSEISLGDTIGAGVPESVSEMLDIVLRTIAPDKLAGHFHDTGERALENVEASLAKGLRVFDAAAGGLGGCPFAPGAKGNLATGKLAKLLHDKGYETGVDRTRLNNAEEFARTLTTTLRTEGTHEH